MSLDVSEILNELEPQERKRLQREWADVFTDVFLPELVVEEPGRLEEAVVNLAHKLPPQRLTELIKLLTAESEKNEAQTENGSKKEE